MLRLKNSVYIDPVDFKMIQSDIFVEKGPEGKIHFTKPAKAKITETLDCNGQYITKAFVVGHHHIYSALAKGMPAPKKSPENFNEILQYVWWTLDKSLDADSIKASAYTAAIEAAKAGSSFIIDHHASPGYIDGSLDIIAEAFDEVGLGHLLCYEITDRDGTEKAEAGIRENENNLKQRQGLVGLHASFTVGDENLQKAAEQMRKHQTGVHIHVAEAEYDEQHCQKKYGMSVIERLEKFGLLDSPKTLIIHGLHLNKKEREILKNSPAWVVQNTESNLNNNVGFFNSEGLSERIMLGTDGMHGDMLRSAQAAFFAGQAFDNIDFPEAYRRFRNTDKYLNDNQFAGYGDNNLVVLDYPSGTPLTEDNFLGHFVFGLRSSHVKHLISQGNIIIKDCEIQTVNEKEILAFSQEQAEKLWTKMAK
jgi:cytosine/adenosine deaminase-related metal-dependent hydrolase